MHFSRNRQSQRNGDEAILPLTNVVFLLLIFFMLAGRLAAPEALDIQPPSSVSESAAESAGLEVQVAADGELALDGEHLTLDALKTQVRQRLNARPDTPLRLKADGEGDASRVVAIMQELREAGAEKLRLITVAADS